MNLLKDLIIFFSILMWLDLILSFISKSFNSFMIENLKEQNVLIDKYRNAIKKLFSKLTK